MRCWISFEKNETFRPTSDQLSVEKYALSFTCSDSALTLSTIYGHSNNKCLSVVLGGHFLTPSMWHYAIIFNINQWSTKIRFGSGRNWSLNFGSSFGSGKMWDFGFGRNFGSEIRQFLYLFKKPKFGCLCLF